MIERRLKVEQLERRLLLASDFGDAPAPYDTLLVDGGPSHVIDATSSTLFLGAAVDAELDGLPSDNANGDDIFTVPGSDDEDGVVEPARDLVLTVGTNPKVRVRATNESGSEAILYGWIDYNQDGVFENATERASINVPDGTSSDVFTLVFPAIAVDSSTGETYARFRLSTDSASADPIGPAGDGEVEDHLATIFVSSEIAFASNSNNLISTASGGGPAVSDFDDFGGSVTTLGDLDGDGIDDLAVGVSLDDSGDGNGNANRGAVQILFLDSSGAVRESTKISPNDGGGPALSEGDRFGASVASLGDFDGDGNPDLLVGASHDNTGGSDTGAAYILLLNPNGTVRESIKIASGLNGGPILSAGDHFGSAIAALGDVDGDGVDDIAVAAEGDGKGALHILFLDATGSVLQSTKIGDGDGGGPILDINDSFSDSLAALGDFDGNGVTELAVGSRRHHGYEGGVYLLFLNTNGTASSSVEIASGVGGGPSLNGSDFYGVSVAALGDVDGDGVPDMAVGADGDDTGGGFSPGAVYVHFMNSSGTVRDTAKIADGTGGGPFLRSGSSFGRSLSSVGDLDGNGITNLAVGSADGASGSIYTISLSATGTANSFVRITGALGGGPSHFDFADFGRSIAPLGDFDGDGVPDIVVGAPGDNGGTVYSPGGSAIHILLMNSDGTVRDSVRIADGAGGGPTLPGDQFGSSLASIGDLDGDGITDLVVGAVSDDTGGTNRGAVYVLFLNSTGTVREFAKIADSTGGGPILANGDGFGSSIASVGDLDGDGISDLAVGATGDDTGGSAKGAVHILYMNSDGSVRSSHKIAEGLNGGPSLGNFDSFGFSLASLGDVDGDGLADLAVGASFDNSKGANRGAVHILFLNAAGTVRDSVKIAHGTAGGPSLINDDYFGSSLAFLGDLDGDGITELAVGAVGVDTGGTSTTSDRGATFILYLNSDGSARTNLKLNSGFGLSNGDTFGRSVANMGDLDNDGIPELAIGADGNDTNGTSRGALHVFSLSPDSTAPELTQIRRYIPTDSLTTDEQLVFRVFFSEHVTGVHPADFIVSGGSTAVVQNVTLSGGNYEVEVSGGDLATFNGNLGIDVAANATITDLVGNLLPIVEPVIDEDYTIDNIPPTLLSLTRQNPSSFQTSADAVLFRATFAEPVYNVDDTDFLVDGTSASLSVRQVSGSIYDLTLSGGDISSLVGFVDIDISPSSDISDLAGVLLPPIEPAIDEQYEFVLSTTDFGDAPDIGVGTGIGNYQTSLADDGPRHTIISGLFLGARIDEEPDATSLASADGDDRFVAPDFDDEDGVVEPAQDLFLTAGSSPTVRVLATNTTGTEATLYGWIDYNQDGVFYDATERTSISVPTGATGEVFALQFPMIPADSPTGTSYARFRLSTDTAAGTATGLALDGEVEDYVATIVNVPDLNVGVASTIRIGDELNGGPDFDSGDRFANSTTAIGDLDGDGIEDLAVGAWLADSGRGAVYILFMNASGSVRESVKIGNQINGGPTLVTNDWFGGSLAALGDIDGDGNIEIAVGNIGPLSPRLNILFMNSDGTVNRHTEISAESLSIPLSISFASSVASIGDLDGDGVSDLALGSNQESSEGPSRGATYVLFMNSDGTVRDTTRIASGVNGGPDLTNSDFFGTSIASLGDLDGDGVTDLAVGAVGDDTSGISGGAVHILFMNPDGTVREASKIANALNGGPTLGNGDGFGSSVASAGDLDGNGTIDLVVGANYDDGLSSITSADYGTIYLLLMKPSGAAHEFFKFPIHYEDLPGLTNDDGIGKSVANIGDLNDDGVIELAVGTTTLGNGQAVYILSLAVDTTAPELLAFSRQTPAEYLTRADSLVFEALFNEDVIIDTADLTVVGGSTAIVQDILKVGFGRYEVTVAGGDLGTFVGAVGLDLAAGATITDLLANPLPLVEPPIDETYLVVPLGTTDFGDAPAPYPTLFSENAPTHGMGAVDGPQLGPTRDYELDGQPSDLADGDGSDEDGVAFGTIRVGQVSAPVTVNVQGSAGLLDGWIDFNGDGSWGGPGEQIFASHPVTLGDNNLTFELPSWATQRTTYARFRLSSSGGLGPTGPAADGEIEDYAVFFESPQVGGGFFAPENVITTNADGAQDVVAVDLDRDGDLDVLSASSNDDEIAWYENDGSESFTRHLISTDGDGPQSVIAADLDRDGDIDVLSVSFNDDTIAWHENNGSQNFISHVITTGSDGAEDVFVADIDSDGDLDVLAASRNDDTIAWHENDGYQSFSEQVITTNADGAQSIFATDLDRDGDIDVLAASSNDDTIAWYENDGDNFFSQRIISTSAIGPSSVIAADLDQDGDQDVLSSSWTDNRIAWYENDGASNFTTHTIAATASYNDLFVADIDGDGDLDILSGSLANGVSWHENDGLENFNTHAISSTPSSSRSVFAADIDGDDILELLAASFSEDSVAWYENSYGVSITSPGGTIAEDSGGLIEYEIRLNTQRLTTTTLEFTVESAAVSGVDYTLTGATSFDGVNGTVEFPAGETMVGLVITPIDDNVREFDESFRAYLEDATGFAIDNTGAGTWTILSDEFGGDFGDAPATYGTLFANNGAAHNLDVAGSLRLGSTVDGESDGQPSELADGEGADDDGVVFGELRVGQVDATATINVQNAPTGARLDAWFDFNGDGNWLSAEEQIVFSELVSEGENTIQFSVPADAAQGSTYARFRISTTGGLSPVGLAADGEVEDYLVEILPPRRALGILPTANSIVSSEGEVRSLFAIDLDKDLDNDIVAAAGNAIVWYENDGTGSFTEHVVVDTFYYATSVKVADVDRDGDLDIVSASYSGDKIAWYENDGAFNFTEQIVTTNANGAKHVEVVDLDGDGDLDVLVASELDDTIAWYENDGSQLFTEHIVENDSFDTDGAYAVHAIDMDRDSDLDLVVGAGGFFGDLAWYENDGNQSFTRREIFGTRYSSAVYSVDLDNDGDLDLLAAFDDPSSFGADSIDWFENDGSQLFTRHEIPVDVSGPSSVYPTDLDADGDWDILVTSTSGDTLSVLVNDGSQSFVRKPIYSAPDSSDNYAFNTVIAADLDGDGDLEVIAAPQFANEIVWYESYPDGTSATTAQPTIVEDSAGSSTIVLTRVTDISTETVFDFQMAGSASHGIDYTITGATSFDGVQGSVTFLAGESTAELVVTSIPDADFEDHETIRLQLFQSMGIELSTIEESPFEVIVTILRDEANDFGDAPDTYKTTLAVDGAAHGDQGPTLGSTRDADLDGQPTAPADGDGADEDGVTFSTIHVGQQNAAITVNVQNAPLGARLDAWFDLDGDGNWHGAYEQIAKDLAVVEGDNLIEIDVPSHIPSGETFARFRLSSAGNLSYSGFEVDGEVEDYRVTIQPPAESGAAFSLHPSIGTTGTGEETVSTADVDGDGDIDIVSGGSTDSRLRWFENQNNGDIFLEHTIENELDAYLSIQAIDFDRDGDLDVLTSNSDGTLNWYENDGTQTFTARSIASLAIGASGVIPVDLDGDTHLDLLSVSLSFFTGGEVLWHKNDGDHAFTTHTIGKLVGDSFFSTPHVAAGDFDGDGDFDVIAGPTEKPGFFEEGITWFENLGDLKFREHELDDLFTGVESLSVADIDSDGNLDVVYLTDLGSLGLLKGDGTGGFTQETIDFSSFSSRILQIADLDGDSDLDILVATFLSDSLFVYENNGSVDPDFERISLFGVNGRQDSAQVADIDGDGDLDLVTSSATSDSIVWHENIVKDAGDFDGNGRVDGLDFLALQRGFGKSGAGRSDGDADGDGDVQYDDLKDWEATYGYTTPPDPVPGDFDRDGIVTGLDFLAWQRDVGRIYDQSHLSEWETQYLANSIPEDLSSDGDLNSDGIVDGLDFLEWQRGAGTSYQTAHLIAWENNYGSSTVQALADDLILVSAWKPDRIADSHELLSEHEVQAATVFEESTSVSRRRLVDLAMAIDSNETSHEEPDTVREELHGFALLPEYHFKKPVKKLGIVESYGLSRFQRTVEPGIREERTAEEQYLWEDVLDEAIDSVFA